MRVKPSNLIWQDIKLGFAKTFLLFGNVRNHKMGRWVFPKDGLFPTTLTRMEINFCSNFQGLNGKAFQKFTSLAHLQILCCHNLQCLPEEELPTSLFYFSFSFINQWMSFAKEMLSERKGRLAKDCSHSFCVHKLVNVDSPIISL